MTREVPLVVSVMLNHDSKLTDGEVREEVRLCLMDSDCFMGGVVQLADKVSAQ